MVENSISNYDPDNECPICFNNITPNDSFYTMTCCKKNAHIDCIMQWYKKQTTSFKCFICNQNNTIQNDLLLNCDNDLSNITTLSHDNLVITIENNRTLIDNNVTHSNLISRSILCKIATTCIFISGIIFLSIFYIL